MVDKTARALRNEYKCGFGGGLAKYGVYGGVVHSLSTYQE
jgi:hypothetical protein